MTEETEDDTFSKAVGMKQKGDWKRAFNLCIESQRKKGPDWIEKKKLWTCLTAEFFFHFGRLSEAIKILEMTGMQKYTNLEINLQKNLIILKRINLIIVLIKTI